MPLGLAPGLSTLPNSLIMSPRSFALPGLALILLLLSGCRDREITSYRAPKERPPPRAAAANGEMPANHPPIGGNQPAPGTDMAATPVPTAGASQLQWSAPAHWTAKPLGPMRKGSFALKASDGSAEADLSITAFPGNTGGLEANLNRWRGQVSLGPLDGAALQSSLEHLDANGLHFDLVELTGTANGQPTTILGAILSKPDETWFFKLLGPTALVTAEKAAFRSFIQTVREGR